ncbi:uncharacterized protein PAC_02340 [Phialocephala subalpina]|uniref:Uncharacterized protein n=1 Tax=Phialocephala subalpina TaxID=576137 RepID=A0A1L7WI61_9HELO|nr:uncharacterized protein PAC_02340 [Phialocephala subalpina]
MISARPRKVLATRTARNVSGFGFGGALQPKSDLYMNEIFASRSDGCCKSNMMENSRREDVEMMWVD